MNFLFKKGIDKMIIDLTLILNLFLRGEESKKENDLNFAGLYIYEYIPSILKKPEKNQ